MELFKKLFFTAHYNTLKCLHTVNLCTKWYDHLIKKSVFGLNSLPLRLNLIPISQYDFVILAAGTICKGTGKGIPTGADGP